MAYVELQLQIDNRYRVTATTSDGASQYGELNLSDLHRDLIAVFNNWLQENIFTRRQEFEALGSLLYESLFDNQIGGFFINLLDKISDPDRLRLQLIFSPEVLELANIPWEFLYFPEWKANAGFFLCTHPKLVLSRYLPRPVERPQLKPATKPLRLLFVISRPESLGAVLAAPVVDGIRGNFPESEIQINILKEPTMSNLFTTVEEYNPHLLHFIGHGKYDSVNQEGSIALLDDDLATPVWVTDRGLANFFDRVQPSLVFLHACEGGRIDFARNFAGMGPQLIRKGVPAVVAMQYPVTNHMAIDFSTTFYQQLARGEPVDAAVQESRRLITIMNLDAYGKRDFGTPVLYMQSRDGAIMS